MLPDSAACVTIIRYSRLTSPRSIAGRPCAWQRASQVGPGRRFTLIADGPRRDDCAIRCKSARDNQDGGSPTPRRVITAIGRACEPPHRVMLTRRAVFIRGLITPGADDDPGPPFRRGLVGAPGRTMIAIFFIIAVDSRAQVSSLIPSAGE